MNTLTTVTLTLAIRTPDQPLSASQLAALQSALRKQIRGTVAGVEIKGVGPVKEAAE